MRTLDNRKFVPELPRKKREKNVDPFEFISKSCGSKTSPSAIQEKIQNFQNYVAVPFGKIMLKFPKRLKTKSFF